jgi:hypothetical protein
MNATAADIRAGLRLFGKVQVQVQGADQARPLEDFTPYGNEERTDLTLGHVYRGGQWINVEIREEA